MHVGNENDVIVNTGTFFRIVLVIRTCRGQFHYSNTMKDECREYMIYKEINNSRCKT